MVMSDLSYLKSWLHARTASGSSETEGRELLEELDQFFAYIFNSSKDGISVLDLDLTILGVNTAMERWYDSALPLVGKKCYAIYHGRSTPCENCPSLSSIRSGRPHVGVVPYEGAGHQRGTQELSVFPLYDNDKKIFGLLEYVRDISNLAEEDRIVDNLKRRIQFQEQTLREQEIALDVLMRQGDRAEKRIAQYVVTNMSSLVEPLMERMKARYAGTGAAEDFDLLATRLKSITSPFMQSLSLAERGLTHREREVASFVRAGKSTKEISESLGVSMKTVDYHRANLRKKLGLANSEERLQTYLSRIDKPQVSPGI
jgi:DNA-binding CsgD family transcriptional regulator